MACVRRQAHGAARAGRAQHLAALAGRGGGRSTAAIAYSHCDRSAEHCNTSGLERSQRGTAATAHPSPPSPPATGAQHPPSPSVCQFDNDFVHT